jgi:hypothetical protein
MARIGVSCRDPSLPASKRVVSGPAADVIQHAAHRAHERNLTESPPFDPTAHVTGGTVRPNINIDDLSSFRNH